MRSEPKEAERSAGRRASASASAGRRASASASVGRRASASASAGRRASASASAGRRASARRSASRRLRILHVSIRYSPALGGAEEHVRQIARFQAEAGHEVHVLTTPLATEVPLARLPDLPERERDGEVEIHRLPCTPFVPRLWGYGVRIQGLRETLTQLEPDIVHAHGYGYDHTDRLARWRDGASWRFVLTSHGFVRGRGLLRPAKRLYDLTWGRATLQRVDAGVAVAPADAEVLRAAGCRRVEMVANGVDLGRFTARPARQAAARAVRQELGLAGPVLLAVGRLSRLKGQDVTIRAMAGVRAHFPQAVLLLIGPDGGAERKLHRLVEALGLEAAVRFLGPLVGERLVDAYAAADLLVHPARAEPFGLVLLEAMASGVPIVASPVGGIPFAVGEAADLVPPEPRMLAATLRRLLSDPERRAELAARGRARASRFSWPRAGERLLVLYRDLTAPPCA